MESVWPISKLSSESVGSRRVGVGGVYWALYFDSSSNVGGSDGGAAIGLRCTSLCRPISALADALRFEQEAQLLLGWPTVLPHSRRSMQKLWRIHFSII